MNGNHAESAEKNYGGRLHHDVPDWVREDAIFHVRVRCQRGSAPLTEPGFAAVLLNSAMLYHTQERWWVHLFLLMPDHWHALLSFGQTASMSRVVGDWKHYHACRHGVNWQEGYFDHRLRNDVDEFDAKYAYIRANPVVKGLCAQPADWPWWTAPLRAPLG